jgi:chemotaxis family two-component system sensor kinase Cph1
MTMVDLRDCDAEPIRIPGSIQPHGVLMALDARTLRVLEISANCVDYLGVAPKAFLGRRAETALGNAASAISGSAGAEHLANGAPMLLELEGGRFEALLHRHQGMVIVELERHHEESRATDLAVRVALARLQRPNNVSALCAIAVDAVRKLTGFDRVMLYRFDAEGHGEVIEEATADLVTSYRGLHFPASDIPRQARELYLLNWLRLIPDAKYTPVPLIGLEERAGPLDLTFATLRSVSPVHLEYLGNMGVRASMSVSLVKGTTLWGLVACHHRTPRHVSFAVRAACEVIGRVVALQIGAQEELESREARDALRGTEARLVDAMRSGPEDVAASLALRGDALLAILGATGAAISSAGTIRTVGVAPSIAELARLFTWLGKHGAEGVVHTDSLATRHPPAADYTQVASGLVAIALPYAIPAHVVWFRPEIIQTVSWAGDPEKPVELTDQGGRLRPRHSFDAWTEVVRGRSKPWKTVEIDTAEDLRRRAIEIDLTQQILKAERAVRLRDELVAVVSHDLKGPLQVVQMATARLQQQISDNAPATSTLSRVDRAAKRMHMLISDLLDLAKIEAGRFELALASCAVGELVADAAAILASQAEAKGVRLSWGEPSHLRANADAERVFQVISNIVGNAIKFTPAGGTVDVAIRDVDGSIRFTIKDSGPGIPSTQIAHLFDRYWQARHGSHTGSGLGLYIAKGIVEAHGRRISVESTYGDGATFTFELPEHVSLAPPVPDQV